MGRKKIDPKSEDNMKSEKRLAPRMRIYRETPVAIRRQEGRKDFRGRLLDVSMSGLLLEAEGFSRGPFRGKDFEVGLVGKQFKNPAGGLRFYATAVRSHRDKQTGLVRMGLRLASPLSYETWTVILQSAAPL